MKKTKLEQKTINFNTGSSPLLIIFVLLVVFAGAFLIYMNYKIPPKENNNQALITNEAQQNKGNVNTQMAKFSSDAEFKKYMLAGQDLLSAGLGSSIQYYTAPTSARQLGTPDGTYGINDLVSEGANLGTKSRISSTNVQVVGIDEPDIVKTDGREIYYGGQPNYYYYDYIDAQPMIGSSRIAPPNYNQPQATLVKATPPADMKVDSNLDKSGNLLVSGNTLMVFDNSQNGIYAYDTSDKTNPKQSWQMKMESNTRITTSRLYNDKLYLVMTTMFNEFSPCPLKTLSLNDKPYSIACTEIYHPVTVLPVDNTLTIMRINPQTGAVEDKTAFMTSSYSSIVYMSENSIYLTYTQEVNYFDLFLDILHSQTNNIFPADLVSKLEKLKTYDISLGSKMAEMETLIMKWQSSLGKDDSLKMENEMENLMKKYVSEHKREIVKTEIVKLGVKNLALQSTGLVTGTLLNQFSMDENNGYLRIATNIGGSIAMGFSDSSEGSANDVYVLDNNLKTVGSVLDLGLTERIYSVRFVDDAAYLVTFRQTDPFYVIDLSNPKNPQLKGELKIPGYSSYLHPISQNRILGIGQEGGQLKLSLFDVSDKTQPKEVDKYTLNEYGGGSSYDHHAFLQDAKHQVFFVPGYNGAYIFSYANDKLQLVKAVSENQVKRAVYLNDVMYIISNQAISAHNENDWLSINRIDFGATK